MEKLKENEDYIFTLIFFVIAMITAICYVSTDLSYLSIENSSISNYGKPIAILSVIVFFVVGAVSGWYENKVNGNKINVASVLKEDKKDKNKKSININTLVQLILLVTTGLMVPGLISFVLMIPSLLIIGIMTNLKKFDIVNLFYNIYFIGMTSIIENTFGFNNF